MIGAFHGAMATTTPAGARTAMASFPGMSDGMTSPVIQYACAAASRSIPAASETLNIPQPKTPPVSSVMVAASVSPRSSSRSAARRRIERRSAGALRDQAGKAAAAASTAARASSRPAAAAEPTVSPVNGKVCGYSRPEAAGRHSPPINRCCIALLTLLSTDIVFAAWSSVRKAYIGMAEITSLSDALRELVHDGDSVALEGFTHLIPFAAGHEVLRQGRAELELIRMTPDILYDQMI